MIRFFAPFLVLALALVSFFYFTTPVLDQIDVLKTEKEKLTAALANATQLEERQSELQNRRSEIDPADLEKLKQLLPNNIDNVRLIIDINNIAKKRGLTVRNPSIAKESDPNQVSGQADSAESLSGKSSVVISFSVSASYEIFKLFLDDLSRSLRIVDVENISFTSNDRNFYDYKVSLRTYWLK